MKYKTKIILFIILLVSKLFGLNCSDYKDFKEYNGHYYTTTINKMSFDYAKQFAEKNNGYIAIPNDESENIFISSLLTKPQYAWIGILDTNHIQNYCKEKTPNSSKPTILTCNGNFPNSFIFSVYANHLCRCPDQAGYDYWVSQNIQDPKLLKERMKAQRISQHDQNTWFDNCHYTFNCAYDDSRFTTINGSYLSYKNFHDKQPDNLVKYYDVDLDGKPRIEPLGENWVAISSVDGKWADFGNHFDEYNNPIKYIAVFEFDSMPECYTPETIVSDKLEDLSCNSQILRNGLNNNISDEDAITKKCEIDEHGVEYCPMNLKTCSDTFVTNDGFATQHQGTYTSCNDGVIPTIDTNAAFGEDVIDCNQVNTSISNANLNSNCLNGYYPDGSQCGLDSYHNATISSATCPYGGTLVDTNFNCTGNFPNTTIKSWYNDNLCRCPDQAGYDYWLNEYNNYGSSYARTAFENAAKKNGEWRNNCSSPSGWYCSKSCYNKPYCPNGGTLNNNICKKECTSNSYSCPNGGTLSGNICKKTCTNTSSCTTSCSWWSSSKGFGGKSTHTGCGHNHSDYWGDRRADNSEGSCTGKTYDITTYSNCDYTATLTTTKFDCSYEATAGYYYDCSYNASISYSCDVGTVVGSQCKTTEWIEDTQDYSCSNGENNLKCNGNFSNNYLVSLYKNHLCRCPDQVGYDYWQNELNTGSLSYENITIAFKNGVSNGDIWVESCSAIDNNNASCSGNYPNSVLYSYYTEHLCRCPDQAGYDYWLNSWDNGSFENYTNLENTFKLAAALNDEVWSESCSKLNQDKCFSSTIENQEVTEEPYNYYTYHCQNELTNYDEPYIVQDKGGKEETNPIPPVNNCVAKSYRCDSDNNQLCIKNNGIWKCSDNPCIDGDDIEITDTKVGLNDKNNDGWGEDGSCNGQIFVFNGKDNRCRSKDKFFGLFGGGCCEKDKVFLNLITCKEEEKKLAKLNNKNVCHYIGEYCSKKIGIANICIQKKKTYCCFNSTLARILNEQGRIQISKGWGMADNPDCSGFKPEEFQKIDFSQIDLGEFKTELGTKMNTSSFENLGNFVSDKVNTILNSSN